MGLRPRRLPNRINHTHHQTTGFLHGADVLVPKEKAAPVQRAAFSIINNTTYSTMNARNPTRREAQELSIVNDFKSRDRAIRAIESSSIDITARYIGIAMLMMMWPVTDGDLCKAIDEIAKAANVSKSTVLRHLPELYDAGFVVAEHGTGGKKSRYTFPLGVNSDTELDHELVVNGDTKRCRLRRERHP
ncbi:DNA-binding transcriptional ArsR family regulator [Bradyrhizobium elkanii]